MEGGGLKELGIGIQGSCILVRLLWGGEMLVGRACKHTCGTP
jgi:hypothetical protein